MKKLEHDLLTEKYTTVLNCGVDLTTLSKILEEGKF